MNDTDITSRTDAGKSTVQTRRSQLSRILEERPEARSRLGNAVAALLGTFLVAVSRVRRALDLAHHSPRPLDPRTPRCSPRDSICRTSPDDEADRPT